MNPENANRKSELYMPQDPENHWLTATQAAESCEVTSRTFRNWGVRPVAVIGTRHYYDGQSILANRLDALKQRRRPEGTPAELKAAVDRLETELTQHRAQGERLRNSERRGETTTVESLTAVIAEACSACSAGLEALPGAIKRAQPETSAQELHHIRGAIVRRQNQAAGITLQDLDHWSN